MLLVQSWTDDQVTNANVEPGFPGTRHLLTLQSRSAPDGSTLSVVETLQSRIRVAVATRTHLDKAADATAVDSPHGPQVQWHAEATAGTPLAIDKTAAIFTSRDHAIAEASLAAERELQDAPSMPEESRTQAAEWRHVWRRLRLHVELHEDERESHDVQRALSIHIFHIGQSLSRHSSDADVGVPARGLHGEAYSGRVFWDELFVFPLLNLRMP
jgi:trehalose/maltose hydrolase-like predicted phosphorylase